MIKSQSRQTYYAQGISRTVWILYLRNIWMMNEHFRGRYIGSNANPILYLMAIVVCLRVNV